MNPEKAAGISLLAGSLLLTFTMVLHPAGGNTEHLIRISLLIMITHSVAIASLPVLAMGFKGLSGSLGKDNPLSSLSFIIACFGLVAGMFAALVNGIILPLFLKQLSSFDQPADPEMIRAIRIYGNCINIALDYVLISALTLSVAAWSVCILRHTRFPRWTGYYGIFLAVLGLCAAFNRFDFVNLHGIRLFIFGLVSWLVAIGIFLARKPGPAGA